jgi:starch-binding outer membrane protein, SusD/RagB family
MKLFRFLAVAGIAVAATACGDLDVVNLNDPDRQRAISTPTDVESLISGSFSSWWSSGHYSNVGVTMSTMADAHSSSWGNFAMREMSSEPRVAYNNDPSASYAYVTRNTWRDSYAALSGVRDGLLAIEGGVDLGTGGADNQRAQTFAALVQGLALTRLANTFDQAFVIDELTSLDDPNALPEMVPFTDVHAAGLAKLDQAISMAGQGSFEIPSAWVGDGGAWSNTRLAQVAHGFKARAMISVARSEADRAAVNWGAVMSEVNSAHTEDYNTVYDDVNWAWDRLKVHAGANDVWARIDLRMAGPADQSGRFQTWIGTSNPELREPFLVDTDDARVTAPGDPEADGTYMRYVAGHRFRPERGIYHFSNYSDLRWYPVRLANYVGTNGVFPVKELEFIMAEGLYRTGDQAGAAAIVNNYRVANGGLAAVTTAGTSGARCTPRTDSGACGDLWEALKYDKRVEVWHYGYGVEFFDDRGWGDLVTNTPYHFPVPGAELDLLLMDIYTFGGGGEASAPRLWTDVMDAETIRWRADALDAYGDAVRAELNPGVIN